MVQKFLSIKDLGFFDDGSIDLNGNEEEGGLCLINSTLEVSSTWLVDSVCGKFVSKKDNQIILITFTNRTNLHLRGVKRYSGVDVGNAGESSFKIIDLSSDLFVNDKAGFGATKLNNLFTTVKKATSNSTKPIIVIEEPDFLLASSLYTWNQLSEFIFDLRQISSQCFISCNGDESLIHPTSPIGESQNKFLTQLIHSSSIIITLRPFETGRADDVTGILRITRGPRISSKTIIENEYLYHVADSVKLFYR